MRKQRLLFLVKNSKKFVKSFQQVNKLLQKFVNNQRLSLMQWETLSAVIGNTINDLPICVGSKTDVENLDLITPNRLRLGKITNEVLLVI